MVGPPVVLSWSAMEHDDPVAVERPDSIATLAFGGH
jgi:hypothetical protein